MTYFVVRTFDLKDASRDDYVNAYAELATLGLASFLVSDSGSRAHLPTTTTAGIFKGASAAAVRDHVSFDELPDAA